MTIRVGEAATFTAHSSVLNAFKKPRRPKKHAVTVADMPPAALLQFAYTGTLPVVAGTSGAGHIDTLEHLLLAAGKYGMPRLQAIFERLLSKYAIEVQSVAKTLAMADRHGFDKLKEVCVEFVTNPEPFINS